MDATKRKLLRLLRVKLKYARQRLDTQKVIADPFDRGYYLGRAHAAAEAIRQIGAMRETAK